MKVANARDRFRLEQPQQFCDVPMGLDGDLLVEIHQQRLIARALKAHD